MFHSDPEICFRNGSGKVCKVDKHPDNVKNTINPQDIVMTNNLGLGTIKQKL